MAVAGEGEGGGEEGRGRENFAFPFFVMGSEDGLKIGGLNGMVVVLKNTKAMKCTTVFFFYFLSK